MLILKLFVANLHWLHVITVENLLSHQLFEDWLSFILVYSFIVVSKNENYCNFKDIDMSILPYLFNLFATDLTLEKLDLMKLTLLNANINKRRRKITFFSMYFVFFNTSVGNTYQHKNKANILVFSVLKAKCNVSSNFQLYRIYKFMA